MSNIYQELLELMTSEPPDVSQRVLEGQDEEVLVGPGGRQSEYHEASSSRGTTTRPTGLTRSTGIRIRSTSLSSSVSGEVLRDDDASQAVRVL